MGSSVTPAVSQCPPAPTGAPGRVQENGENGGHAAGRRSNISEQENCRQSPQLIAPSVANFYPATFPSSQMYHAAVQTPRIPSLFGAPKGGSLDLLKPLFLWLFPNLLAALVFAVTLIACLMCNATIEFDMCFLLLLIASWALVAAAASRRGAQALAGDHGGPPGSPLKIEVARRVSKKVSGVEDDVWQGEPVSSPTAREGSRLAAPEGVTGLPVVLDEEGCPPLRWVSSKLWPLCSRPYSSSTISYETTTPRSNSRESTDESVGASDDGPCEVAQQAVGEHRGLPEVHETEEEDASCSEAVAASYAAAEGFFPFSREEGAAETAEERERCQNEMEETEEKETNSEEAQHRCGCDDVSGIIPAPPVSGNSATSTEFSAWLGALGEVTLSSCIADLSFCRTQTLAAALSPHEQSMSIEMEGPPVPTLPFSSHADVTDNKGAPTSLAELQQPVSFEGSSLEDQVPQQGHSAEVMFPHTLPGEDSQGVTTEAADVVLLENLLEHHLQQHQLPPLQHTQRRGSLSRGAPTSPMPGRRSGGVRRTGGAPTGGKIQRRESKAALQYYMGLVKDCCKRRDGAGALRVLEEVQREGKVAPDVQLLNYVLFACVASQDAFLTKRLFEFIEGAGVADIVTYNTMLKSFSLSGQLEEAEKILRRMRGRNVPPDEVSFNLLVNAAVSCGRIDRAWHYVDELKTANMVVRVLCFYLPHYQMDGICVSAHLAVVVCSLSGVRALYKAL